MPIYDVENRFSYYKNYSDNILVGPPKPTIGSSIWQRSVSGSVVSGSEEWKAATVASDFIYQRAHPFYKSGEVRYLRIASSTQKIEDSFVPDVISLHATGTYGAGKPALDQNFAGSGKDFLWILFATSSFPAITGSDSGIVSNYEWINSYPFEKKYSYVPRSVDRDIYRLTVDYELEYTSFENIFQAVNQTVSIDKKNIIVGSSYINTVSPYTKSLDLLLDIPGYYDPGYTDPLLLLPNDWHEYSYALFLGSMVNNYGRKLVYGIKPSYVDSIVPSPSTLGSYENYYYQISYTVDCEGWKYGLYNGIPTNFSCVFRQNHYGQPMDMLEGRPYTKTYNNPEIGGPLDEGGGINFISASALAGESNNWLTASIYGGTNVAAAYTVNPYGSGIFDKEYRASQPWHDDDPRLGT